ncbi:SusC/RagA family TonB-linked outer membrane protein [Paradesertivirga mongoliensis]|uniref:SusC/RagA family TonB-linked outer membrane protein n=1 Tax=Paradesertivirga mongoliensis TaxID=2100740 RepID=A0ABW4ZJI4_9SPHI|nr:TonB-dependent receptor [Pedobacter mongoliensis]
MNLNFLQKIFLALLVCLWVNINAYAQTNFQIQGTVTGEDNLAIPGVNVIQKGTSNGVVADVDGKYSINISGTQGVLVFSFMGYVTKEVPVNGRSIINVSLESDVKLLDQVVVVGYGTAKKTNVVGALDVISSKSAGQNAATNAAQLLIGKSAGVQVINSSGVPGSSAQIIIRGTGSFKDASPLYVIDGIQGDFNSVSPQDIENITILKDASSTAIYGSAAANGVVIVTTKRAKTGAPKITFNTKMGTARAWRQLDPLNTSDYVDLIKDIAASNARPVPAKFTSGSLSDVTDWQKEILKTGMVSENYLNVSGGSDKVLYNLSIGHINQQAIVKDYRTSRLNTRLGLEETLGRFRFGQNINIRYTANKGQLASLQDAVRYAPYKPIHDASVLGGYSIVSNVDDNSNVNNPLQALGVRSQKNDGYLLFPQLFGEVNIIKGLKFRSQIAFTIGGGSSESFQTPYIASNFLTFGRQATSTASKSSTYTFENFFSYDKAFGKHDISATLGNSYIDAGSSSSIGVLGTNIANDNIPNISVALTQTVSNAGVGYGTQFGTLISYFGRLSYTYDGKYIINASMRRDGSSNFGVNNRFGNFPGGGVAWKFSEESFIKDNLPFISSGKLRAGWGRTGNNKINLFLTDVSTYSGTPTGNLVYSFGSNEAFYSGSTINMLSNPNLQWEQTDQTDLGLDLAFLNDRLNIGVDLYKRESTGLLVNVPLPTSNGIGNVLGGGGSIVTNAADAENEGIEVSVGYRSIPKKDFHYSINVNGARNKNNVISLGSQFQAPIRDGRINNLSAMTYTAKGFPIGSFYGYRVDHVAKDQGEIDALNAKAQGGVYQTGLKPGDFIFKDLTGDNRLTEADQEVLGNPMPKFIYGINGTVGYKNFDLNLVISGVSGLKLANTTRFFTHNAATGHNATTAILDRWKKPGDEAALPRAGQNATAAGNLRPSDFFIEDGSFMRVRNLTIGYTIPTKNLSRLAGNVLSSARIYFSAENLLTFTKYEGYDPEISTLDAGGEAFIFRRGMDNFQLPQPRIFMAGLSIGL